MYSRLRQYYILVSTIAVCCFIGGTYQLLMSFTKCSGCTLSYFMAACGTLAGLTIGGIGIFLFFEIRRKINEQFHEQFTLCSIEGFYLGIILFFIIISIGNLSLNLYYFYNNLFTIVNNCILECGDKENRYGTIFLFIMSVLLFFLLYTHRYRIYSSTLL